MVKEYSGIRIAGVCSREGSCSEKAADVAAGLAEELLLNHHMAKDEIKILIYVTQTPLFMTPSTSFYIAKKLQLGQDCFQYDINQGASGMLTGIQLVASLMLSMDMADKGLLLMADDDLKSEVGKRSMAAAVLLEKEGDGAGFFYVKNASRGHAFSYYYQENEEQLVYKDERFFSLGQEMLEKQMQEMAADCSKKGIIPEHMICIPDYDSAVRLPMYIERGQIKGCSMLAAFGAGLSVTTLVCDLDEDIYK